MAKNTVYRTMTEIAADSLKEAILNGRYKPGTRLIPSRLENELNLGRVAIREAIRELTGSGLVISIPNKGAMVAENIDIEEIKEIFEIRYDLEGKACELAAQRISETEIKRLTQINSDLAGYDEDTREYFLLNRKFHLDFYKASGWNFLCQIITQLFDRVLVFRSIYPIERKEVPGYIEEHKQLLDAASARDGKAARRIMARHLKNGFTSMMKRRDETT